MKIIHSVAGMQAWAKARARAGQTIGFVPTMGALHQGHLDLVRAAKKHQTAVVVSVFVNPTQFAPGEDFDKYPRTFEADKAALESVGCEVMFVPTVEEIYPTGAERLTWVTVDELSKYWCGASRPGFFRGVVTVVSKLFNAVHPDLAFFGEKDFQQLTIIQRMTEELLFDVEIIPVPTRRESDGLAMSSRNVYLSPQDRARAAGIFQALKKTQGLFNGGTRDAAVLVENFTKWLENIPNSKLDYAGIADLKTLAPITSGTVREGRLLCAVKLGGTRLIDNMSLTGQ